MLKPRADTSNEEDQPTPLKGGTGPGNMQARVLDPACSLISVTQPGHTKFLALTTWLDPGERKKVSRGGICPILFKAKQDTTQSASLKTRNNPRIGPEAWRHRCPWQEATPAPRSGFPRLPDSGLDPLPPGRESSPKRPY
jgi:hypothetical protein